MAEKELIAACAIFCCFYIIFLIIILAVGILSRLDPVVLLRGCLFSSFCMDSHMINMVYSLIKTHYIREEDTHWAWD